MSYAIGMKSRLATQSPLQYLLESTLLPSQSYDPATFWRTQQIVLEP